VSRPGVTVEKSPELKRLRRENAELKRANAILQAASAFLRLSSAGLRVIAEFIRCHQNRWEAGGVSSRFALC
jgi:hypothetical protein